MYNPYDNDLITDDDAAHRRRGSAGGTDYAYVRGTPVRSPGDGVVIYTDTSNDGSGGRIVQVRHSPGVVSEQMHLQQIITRAGQSVAQGETLGYSGGSAWGSDSGVGTHIHADFVINGVRWGWVEYLAAIGIDLAGESSRPLEGDEMSDLIMVHRRSAKPVDGPLNGIVCLLGPSFFTRFGGGAADGEVPDEAHEFSRTVLRREVVHVDERQFDLLIAAFQIPTSVVVNWPTQPRWNGLAQVSA